MLSGYDSSVSWPACRRTDRATGDLAQPQQLGMSSDGRRSPVSEIDCPERLTRLSQSSLDTEAIQREAIVELRRVIGFECWCGGFVDPQRRRRKPRLRV